MSRVHYKSNNGLVHAQYPLNLELTLCGDAPEGVSWEYSKSETEASRDPNAFDPLKPVCGPVTCPDCIRMILGIRGLRVAAGRSLPLQGEADG